MEVVTSSSSSRVPERARPLRLLSLDGGGVRGLSELFILDTIMHGVRREGRLEWEPLPADYFDLICGTSTGGLIAILLGRLRMSVPEAIAKYRELSGFVFSDEKLSLSSKEKSRAIRLEESIRNILLEKLGRGGDEDTMLKEGNTTGCKTFVCATPSHHVLAPRLFRSYESAIRYYPAKIWEVARATSAAPTILQSIKIGEPGMEEEFVDGALGNNNPVKFVVQEAIEEYHEDRRVGCIVSIGTGRARVAGFKSPSGFQKVLPLDLIEVLKKITTDCQRVADEVNERYLECPGLYHRLNVEIGLDDIALGEWDRLHEVKTHTTAYLETPEIKRKIKGIVDILLERVDTAYPLKKLDGKLRRDSPAPALNDNPPVYFNLPAYSVTNFVDRPGPMIKLSENLAREAARDSISPTIFVLQGMGGCGKSQLALEYCNQARSNQKHMIIVWIDATSPETTLLSFTKVAEAMSKPGFEATEVEENFRFVRKKLDEASQKWLAVFDNFDEPSAFQGKQIKEYFPTTGPGSILVTSRLSEVKMLGHDSLQVDQMLVAEAREVLLRRTGRNRPNQDLMDVTKIVERLGYHALAIDQAGAYILKRDMHFSAYLDCYNRQRLKVLNEAPQIWDYTKIPKDSKEGARSCTTSKCGREHILTLMAFFDVNKLTDALFAPAGLNNKSWLPTCQGPDGWNKDAFQDVLCELRNLSLLQSLNTNSSEASFTVHPLVQDWLKARIGNQRAKQYVVESMLVMSAYLLENGAKNLFNDTDFHAKQFMMAHVDATILAKQEFYESWEFLQGSSLLGAGSMYDVILNAHGRYQQAEELCGAVLKECTNELGEEHQDVLAHMHNLSTYLMSQGKYDEAERLLRKRIAIEIRVHGKEGPNTLINMDTLADLLDRQERYEEADEISQEAMEVSARVLGRDHGATISIIRNRASILQHVGNHSEAARMNKENLEISKTVLGIQHSRTLSIMSNLALCLEDLEDFGEAETSLREALSLTEDVFGPDHPETLISIYNLAHNLCQQGRLTEAEELFRRAYPGFESIYGWQHPHSIVFLSWMAHCLRDLGKHEEAEVLYRRAYPGFESIYGWQHPRSINFLVGMAVCLGNLSKHEGAEELFRRAYPGFESIYGWQHPYSIAFLGMMENCLRDLDKHEEAEAIRKLRETSEIAREKQQLEENSDEDDDDNDRIS
ncbi:hypothetical protein BKA64DRAFT_647894 [Cadophora sp. MPI-SDFR-AT-0126]|nr:hypothetical protein BKA64DRAFT_647894 [Leotiomycetes sp. MPI-SDFR-AT-0126]